MFNLKVLLPTLLINFFLLLSCSEFKFPFWSLLKIFFCTILHFERSNCGLLGYVTLNLYLRILFPASNLIWHVEDNIFFEELVHLSLDWIWLTAGDKSSCVIDTCHRIEIFVITSVASHHVEFRIENIFSMTSVWNTVINDKLYQDFLGIIAVETQILSVATYHISVFSKSFFNTGSTIRAIVLNQSLWTNILNVIRRSLTNSISPSQWLHWSLFLAEINGFLDGINSFFSSKGHFAFSLEKHGIKLFAHFFKVFDQILWILS